MHHLRSKLLCTAVLGLCLTLSQAGTAHAGAVAHLSGWRWQDVMNQMPALKAAGFSALLLSPHTSTCGGPFSDGYDPYDFTRFDSRFGNEHELFWLVGTAHWYGLRVYADMVMNHMCPLKYDYPRFGWNDFHHQGGINDWSNPAQLHNGELFGLADLSHESPYVRGELFNFLVKTNNLGFDGYRFDAAKHVPLWYWRDHVMSNLHAWGKLGFGEVYSASHAELSQYAAFGMSVTDYSFYDAIQRHFRFGGNLAELDGVGFERLVPGRAMTFIENHDVAAPPNRQLALVYLATTPGYPIFYRVDPYDAALRTLLWAHNHKAHGAMLSRWKEHDVLIYERERNLLVGLNQSSTWQHRWVSTSWSRRKLHDHAGHAPEVWTAADGRVQVSIPPMSYVLLSP